MIFKMQTIKKKLKNLIFWFFCSKLQWSAKTYVDSVVLKNWMLIYHGFSWSLELVFEIIFTIKKIGLWKQCVCIRCCNALALFLKWKRCSIQKNMIIKTKMRGILFCAKVNRKLYLELEDQCRPMVFDGFSKHVFS